MSEFLADMSKFFRWFKKKGGKTAKNSRIRGFFGWIYKHMKR